MKNRNKRLKSLIVIIFSLIICEVFWCVNSYAVEEDAKSKIINEQINNSDIKKIEQQLQEYSTKEIKEIIPEFDPQKIITETAKGKTEFDINGMIKRILMYLFKEFYININVLIKLIVLTVLCAILKNLQTSFLSENVSEIAFFACYAVIVSIMLISLKTALTLGSDIIDKMVSFMQATLPILITLMISSGSVTSALAFQPILIMIVQVTATIIKNVFIPIVFLSTILLMVNNISDKIQISKLAHMLNQVTGWALGLVLTIFVAIITVQGSLSSMVDGVTGKAAKFAIGTFVPVVGKCLADAADTVVGCTLLVKNAAGVAAMVGIIIICIVPLLKILALIALYKITCVLVEPISENRITNCINDMSKSLTFILGITASVAIMFLITVTAIITASNATAMMR